MKKTGKFFKRTLTGILSLTMLVNVAAFEAFAFDAPTEETKSEHLDLNSDGSVNIIDFILLKAVILNPENPPTQVSTDTAYSAVDLVKIQHTLLDVEEDEPQNPPTDTPSTPPSDVPTVPPTDVPSTPPTDTPSTPPTDTPIVTWKNPVREDLTHTDFLHNNEIIDEESYQMLLNVANAYGFTNYEINWSDTPIAYGYTNPGLYYCMMNGISYGYAVQVVPGNEISTISSGLKKLVTSEMAQNEFISFRPLTDSDQAEEVVENFTNSECQVAKDTAGFVFCGIDDLDNGESESIEYFDFYNLNVYNAFEHGNWYLIPVDESGTRILEANTSKVDYSTVEAPKTNYWFSIKNLSPDGYLVSRHEFNAHLYTAKYYGFKDFRLESSEEFLYGGYTTGCLIQYSNLKGSCKIVSPEDFLTYWPEPQGISNEELQQYMNVDAVKFYAYIPVDFEVKLTSEIKNQYGFACDTFVFPNAHNFGYNELQPRMSYMFEVTE